MKALSSPQHKSRRRLVRALALVFSSSLGGVGLVALGLGLLLAISVPQPRPAQAVGLNGVITNTTVADFQTCTVLTGVVPAGQFTNTTLSPASGGEVRLTPTLEDYFDDGVINTSLWQTGTVSGPAPVEASGVISLDSAFLRSVNSFTQTVRFFEARASLRATVPVADHGFADIGFGRQNAPGASDPVGSNRLFITDDPNNLLSANARDDLNPVTNTTIGNVDALQFQTHRLVWDVNETRYYVNEGLSATIPTTSAVQAWVWLYTLTSGRTIQVDWARAGQYASSGAYASCIQDAGQVANWGPLNWTTSVPAGTALAFRTRTSVDGVAWSDWSAPLTGAVSGTVTSPSGRYLQYTAELTATNPTASPEIQQVSANYFGPSTVVISPSTATLNPGATQQFTATVNDDNGQAVTGYSFDWQLVAGGGAINNSSGLFTATLTAGTYSNTVRAGTGVVTGFATVAVSDLPPTANAGGPYAGSEGTPVGLSGAASSDPNGGSLTFAWDLDNDGQFDDSSLASPSYTWPDNGSFTIRLLVTDTGNLTSTATANVSIANLAPAVNVGVATAINEGGTFSRSGSFTDPGTDTWTGTVNYGDGSGTQTLTLNPDKTFSLSHVYADDGLYTVSVTVIDDDGGVGVGTVLVTVNNAAPTVSAGGNATIMIGDSFSRSGFFTDLGADTWVATVDYGDGSGVQPLTLNPDKTFSLNHTYITFSTYNVTVRVTDDDGGVGTAIFQVTVNPRKIFLPLVLRQP